MSEMQLIARAVTSPSQSAGADARRISLEDWVDSNYAPTCAPSLNTVRRWVRENRIAPAPEKQGRSYFFHPSARYVGVVAAN